MSLGRLVTALDILRRIRRSIRGWPPFLQLATIYRSRVAGMGHPDAVENCGPGARRAEMKLICPLLAIVLATAMAMSAFAGGKDDFPLNVHVVGMDTKQGAPSGPDMLTPLPYHTFTVHIDDDQRELTVVRQDRLRIVWI